MREYLFRGECTETGDWVKGFYVRLYDDKGHESHRIYPGYAETDCGDYYPDFWEVDPETVGQFTGKTDKNGKKIFEGDILKHQINIKTAIVGKIIFVCGAFVFESSYFKGELISFVDNEIAFPVNCIEVIGNIHDNPELLEGGVEECVKS